MKNNKLSNKERLARILDCIHLIEKSIVDVTENVFLENFILKLQ